METRHESSQKEKLVVLKFSGKALADRERLEAIFRELKGCKAVVVHGGGVEVDLLFEKLHLEVLKKDGLRVSPKEQMPYICGALGGTCNKALVGILKKAGLNAIGLMASDGQSLITTQKSADLGMVGVVKPHRDDFLRLLLSHGITPVLCSLAMDDRGELYNVNADDVATAISALLHARLYLISDVSGVLDRRGTLIPTLDRAHLMSLAADNTITDGMLVKVKSAMDIVENYAIEVCIASYREDLLGKKIREGIPCGTTFIG